MRSFRSPYTAKSTDNATGPPEFTNCRTLNHGAPMAMPKAFASWLCNGTAIVVGQHPYGHTFILGLEQHFT